MTTYRVQRMTTEDYNNYMTGGYNYNIETLIIEAETAEGAIGKATATGYIVNDNVKTLKEVEEERRKVTERIEKEEAKKAERKAKKAEAEIKKAIDMGLTIEEYKAFKNKQRCIKKTQKELAEAEAEVARLKAKLARLER